MPGVVKGGTAPGSDAVGGVADAVRACLRARHEPDALRDVRRAIEAGRVTWGGLCRALVDERVEGLAYPILCDQPEVPAVVLAELRQAYAGYAARNALMLSALARAVERLAEAGIPTLVLKGAALIQTIYPSLGQRPMNDLDVLVPADRAAAAERALRAEGYVWSRPTDLAATLEFENELMLHRAGPIDIVIELHWHLFDAPYYQHRLPMDWFWDSARPLSVNGAGALMLGPEAQLLHLCGHAVLHHGREADLGLRLLVDVAELVRQAAGGADRAAGLADRAADGAADGRMRRALAPAQDPMAGAIDWDLVLRQARAWDMVISLQRVLPAAATGLGAPVPPEVLAALWRLRPSAAEARVVAALTAGEAGVAERFWGDLAGLPGLRTRLRFIRRNLFPSADYMRQRYGYGGWLPPWAYLNRWWLGARDAIRLAGRARNTDGARPRIESGASRVSIL